MSNYSNYNGGQDSSGTSGRNNANPTPFTPYHADNPVNHGWSYQGCNEASKVEYYQRGDVKMDYYPTTGTVKTSMNHPSQGNTQMFRRDLTDSEFSSVAYNPRQHTGKGYQTKK